MFCIALSEAVLSPVSFMFDEEEMEMKKKKKKQKKKQEQQEKKIHTQLQNITRHTSVELLSPLPLLISSSPSLSSPSPSLPSSSLSAKQLLTQLRKDVRQQTSSLVTSLLCFFFHGLFFHCSSLTVTTCLFLFFSSVSHTCTSCI